MYGDGYGDRFGQSELVFCGALVRAAVLPAHTGQMKVRRTAEDAGVPGLEPAPGDPGRWVGL